MAAGLICWICRKLITPFQLSLFRSHQIHAPNKGDSTTHCSGIPCCVSHRRPAILRMVHKEGENKGRQFYACSLPRETKCNFFEVKSRIEPIILTHIFQIYSKMCSCLVFQWKINLKLSGNCHLRLRCQQWADLHFPTCHHGKRCLMRMVLKLGPNNGRNFYTCSFKKGKQCDFFKWAENGPGVSILPGC